MHMPSRLPWWPELIILAALSAMLAWVVNAARPDPIDWRADFATGKIETVKAKGLIVLDSDQALAVWKSGARLFVDARSPAEFVQGHIPGAVNIPEEALLMGLDAAVAALGLAKERPLAVYCSNLACPKAKEVSQGLKELGFSDLAVYPPGLDAWTAEGHVVEGG